MEQDCIPHENVMTQGQMTNTEDHNQTKHHNDDIGRHVRQCRHPGPHELANKGDTLENLSARATDGVSPRESPHR
jgi:hypothetical protein